MSKTLKVLFFSMVSLFYGSIALASPSSSCSALFSHLGLIHSHSHLMKQSSRPGFTPFVHYENHQFAAHRRLKELGVVATMSSDVYYRIRIEPIENAPSAWNRLAFQLEGMGYELVYDINELIESGNSKSLHQSIVRPKVGEDRRVQLLKDKFIFISFDEIRDGYLQDPVVHENSHGAMEYASELGAISLFHLVATSMNGTALVENTDADNPILAYYTHFLPFEEMITFSYNLLLQSEEILEILKGDLPLSLMRERLRTSYDNANAIRDVSFSAFNNIDLIKKAFDYLAGHFGSMSPAEDSVSFKALYKEPQVRGYNMGAAILGRGDSKMFFKKVEMAGENGRPEDRWLFEYRDDKVHLEMFLPPGLGSEISELMELEPNSFLAKQKFYGLISQLIVHLQPLDTIARNIWQRAAEIVYIFGGANPYPTIQTNSATEYDRLSREINELVLSELPDGFNNFLDEVRLTKEEFIQKLRNREVTIF